MNKIFFMLLVAFSVIACSNENKSNRVDTLDSNPIQDSVVSDTKILNDELKSNFNGDSLKESFLHSPFNYIFKDETTVEGTSDTYIKGFENQSNYQKDTDLPNQIVINYNLISRKATSAVFYLNHFKTNNIRVKDCHRMIEFINFFDPKAAKFLINNFKTIFYDESANNKLSNYKTDTIEMIIDHNLFDARKFDKKNPGLATSQYVGCTIKFF